MCASICTDIDVVLLLTVKTGKYRSGDESRPGITPPDEVLDSFSAFVEVLLREQVGSTTLSGIGRAVQY